MISADVLAIHLLETNKIGIHQINNMDSGDEDDNAIFESSRNNGTKRRFAVERCLHF